jgi:serine protein kinase
VSPGFVINAISNAITRNDMASLTSMDMLLALKDAIETDARMDAGRKKQWIEFLVLARKDFYNRWVKEDVHRALFASFQDEAQAVAREVSRRDRGSLDKREVEDPITGDSRPPDERFLRSVEEKIKISESGKLSFRQEVVRKAMVAFKAARSSRSTITRACTRPSNNTYSRSAATCCGSLHRRRGPTTRPSTRSPPCRSG